MSRLATSRTNQDDRGAAIVEFALISGILIMLLLGTISAGLTISHNISLNNGAREAARFGATLPVDSDIPSWLGNVADVAEQATNGTSVTPPLASPFVSPMSTPTVLTPTTKRSQ